MDIKRELKYRLVSNTKEAGKIDFVSDSPENLIEHLLTNANTIFLDRSVKIKDLWFQIYSLYEYVITGEEIIFANSFTSGGLMFDENGKDMVISKAHGIGQKKHQTKIQTDHDLFWDIDKCMAEIQKHPFYEETTIGVVNTPTDTNTLLERNQQLNYLRTAISNLAENSSLGSVETNSTEDES